MRVTFLALAAVAVTADLQPAGAASSPGAPAHAVRWDRRNFNGIWLLAGSDLDDPAASSADVTTPQKEDDLSDAFDTRPQLKGPYVLEYQQHRNLVTCEPSGMPLLTASPYANEILQNDKQINWFQEFPGETWRIYLDGRPHPNPAEYPPTSTGHSTGRWEGNTLVVDTVNIRTDMLLLGQGRSERHLGHSDKMHITQRLRLLDKDHLQIKATVTDPVALVRPWRYTLTFHRHPEEEIIEYLCDDNNHEHLDPKTGDEITEIPPRHTQPK